MGHNRDIFWHPCDNAPLSPRLKVKRAEQHISDLERIVGAIETSDFYSLRIEKNFWGSELFVDLDTKKLPTVSAPQVMGDAIHNLRSALDILFRQSVIAARGELTKHTKFPIFESAQKLKSVMDSGLKQQIGPAIFGFINDVVKPYEGGNDSLWALHELDIMDKHQFIIPVLQFVGFFGICLQDDKGMEIKLGALLTESPHSFPLKYPGKLTVKDKGSATAQILFPLGTPFECQPIIPELHNLEKVVTGVIESFEVLLGRKF